MHTPRRVRFGPTGLSFGEDAGLLGGYDKEKKRARKITGKYLGRITEEGLIPPKEKKETANTYCVKEYGASSVLLKMDDEQQEIYDLLYS